MCRGVDRPHGREQGPVGVALPQERQHVLLEDGLASLDAEVHGPVRPVRVQLDMPMAAVRRQVEEDDEGIADRGAADGPLPDERGRIGLRLLDGVALGLDLQVDDDTRAGALLDGFDGRLERGDRVVLKDRGMVIHRDPVDGIRVGWAGRCDVGRS